MYEGRKGGSKESSSKGNKHRQTGLCLPVTLLKWGGLLQEAQHTPTHTLTHTHTEVDKRPSHPRMYTHSPFLFVQMVTPLFPCSDTHTLMPVNHAREGSKCTCGSYVCCVCFRAYLNLSASVPRCGVLLSRAKPLSPPPPPIASLSAHEETGRRAQRRWRVNGEEREKRGREEARERKTKRRKKRATEGEGLDSCLLPSLEASSSQS